MTKKVVLVAARRPPSSATPRLDLAAVKAAALALSVADQRVLLDALALAVQADASDASSAEHGDREMWAAACVTAVDTAFESRGGAPVAAMLIRRAVTTSACWAHVARFMKAAGLDRVERVKRMACYAVLADLLVEHTRGVADFVHAPFSAKLLAGQADRIAGLFDAAFPGYLAAGLVDVLITQVSAKNLAKSSCTTQ